MNAEKKKYCIDTLSNHLDALNQADLALEAKRLLHYIGPEDLERLMGEYGESPDAYLLPRKNEIIEALRKADKIPINVVYEDCYDDSGKESFAHQEDKQLLSDAIAIALSLEDNHQSEDALLLLSLLHGLEFEFRFYDRYGKDPFDYDSRRFIDVASLLPRSEEVKKTFYRLLLQCEDYKSAFLYFENYHPGSEELDSVSPAFADGFLLYLEGSEFRIDNRFSLLENLLGKLSEEEMKKHADPLGRIYPGALKECLKRLGKEMDLRPIVDSYLVTGEHLSSDARDMLRAAVACYPNEETYIRHYYLDGYSRDLDALFLYLCLPDANLDDIKKEDMAFFEMGTIASLYDLETKRRLLSLFFKGPETKTDDPLGELLFRGQSRYLATVHFQGRKMLQLLEEDLIKKAGRSSSRHYEQIAREAAILTSEVNEMKDFVQSLLDAFPNRPALKRALLGAKDLSVGNTDLKTGE